MGEEEAAAAAARVAEQARELQDAAAGLLSRSSAEEEALRRRAPRSAPSSPGSAGRRPRRQRQGTSTAAAASPRWCARALARGCVGCVGGGVDRRGGWVRLGLRGRMLRGRRITGERSACCLGCLVCCNFFLKKTISSFCEFLDAAVECGDVWEHGNSCLSESSFCQLYVYLLLIDHDNVHVRMHLVVADVTVDVELGGCVLESRLRRTWIERRAS